MQSQLNDSVRIEVGGCYDQDSKSSNLHSNNCYLLFFSSVCSFSSKFKIFVKSQTNIAVRERRVELPIKIPTVLQVPMERNAT